jgi:hypothetical protein
VQQRSARLRPTEKTSIKMTARDNPRRPLIVRRIATIALCAGSVATLAACGAKSDAADKTSDTTSQPADTARRAAADTAHRAAANADAAYRAWLDSPATVQINAQIDRHIDGIDNAFVATDLPGVAREASAAATLYDQLATQATKFTGPLASVAYTAYSACSSANHSTSDAAEHRNVQALLNGAGINNCGQKISDLKTEVRVYDAAHGA